MRTDIFTGMTHRHPLCIVLEIKSVHSFMSWHFFFLLYRICDLRTTTKLVDYMFHRSTCNIRPQHQNFSHPHFLHFTVFLKVHTYSIDYELLLWLRAISGNELVDRFFHRTLQQTRHHLIIPSGTTRWYLAVLQVCELRQEFFWMRNRLRSNSKNRILFATKLRNQCGCAFSGPSFLFWKCNKFEISKRNFR